MASLADSASIDSDTVSYLREQGVARLFESAARGIVAERPEDPVAWLSTHFAAASKGATAAAATPEAKELCVSVNAPTAHAGDSKQTEEERVKQATERKRIQQETRQLREAFFEAHLWAGEGGELYPPPCSVKCAQIGCVALAFSEVLQCSPVPADHSNERVTIEDIFHSLSLPLHYIALPSMTMAEVYDIARAYAARGGKVEGRGIVAEVVHFDHDVIDKEHPDDCVGEERTSVLDLSQFRKEMARDMQDPSSVHILNYDPWVLQEAQAAALGDEDDIEADIPGDSPRSAALRAERVADLRRRQAALRRHPRANQGAFGVLASYNEQLAKVRVAEVHICDGGARVTMHECTLAQLYDACGRPDGYSRRPRGYIKLYQGRRRSVDAEYGRSLPGAASAIQQLYTDGELAAVDGMLLAALDVRISPHVAALGYAVHLFNAKNGGAIPRSHGDAADTALVDGVAVRDVVATLRLPLETVVGGSGPRSLHEALSMCRAFLDRRGVGAAVHCCAVPIARRGGASDGVPNLDEDELEDAILRAGAENGRDVLVLAFDVNAAHNVFGLEVDRRPWHYGVLAGYDTHSKVVRIADVSPKKFKQVWHAPLQRLWHSMVGGGYLLISGDRGRASAHGGERYSEEIMASPLYSLPPELPPGIPRTLEFPPRIHCVTMIAYSLTLLGHPVSVEDVLARGGFHTSFLLSDHLSLGDFERVYTNTVHALFGDQLSCAAVHLDPAAADDGGAKADRVVSREQFAAALAEHAGRLPERALLLNYPAARRQEHAEWGNGGAGGSYGVLISYDAGAGIAVVADACRDQLRRVWRMPAAVLYELCCEADPASARARGWLSVSRRPTDLFRVGRGFDLRRVPLTHPFKPPVSAQVAAIAFAATELGHASSPEAVLYAHLSSAAPGGSGLSLVQLGRSLPLSDAVDIARRFVDRRRLPLGVDPLPAGDAAALRAAAAAAVDADCAVVVAASAAAVFGAHAGETVCGLLSHADDADGVTVVDAAPTRWGRQWRCGWDTLLRACAGPSHGLFSLRRE